MQVGPLEILVILVIALLIFGPNKLPELARTVGRGMREVRRLQRMVQRELDDVLAEPTPSPRPTTGARTAPPDDGASAPSGGGAPGDGASGDGAGQGEGEARGPVETPDPGREPT
jgi:TatA/E family protein of Tat protein translocase